MSAVLLRLHNSDNRRHGKRNVSVTYIQRNLKERKIFPLQAGSVSHNY
jgi:hypothetical protein